MHPNLNKPTDFIAITFRDIGVRVVEAPDAKTAVESVRHLYPVAYTRLNGAELNAWRATGRLPVRVRP